jgi:hypothetical protein
VKRPLTAILMLEHAMTFETMLPTVLESSTYKLIVRIDSVPFSSSHLKL